MSEPLRAQSTSTWDHEAVDRAVARAGVDRLTGPSGEDEWTRFVACLRTELGAQAESQFRALFQESPAPTMSQDYSRVIGWMNQLHADGVWNLRSHLEGRLDRLREAVQLIEITAINPAGVKVLGVTFHQALGPVDPAIVNEGAAAAWTDQLLAIWNGERSVRVEFEAMHRNGHVFDARLTMAVPDAGGRPDYTRCIVTIHDISEERRREREMQQLIDAKNRFVSVVSHEIRTPISAVVGYAQLLRDEGTTMSGSDLAEVFDILANEARETNDLVEDLLVATRAELGALSVLTEPVETVAEIQRVLAGLRVEGVRLEVGDDALGRVCAGDAKRVRQILRNLVTNADRYGGDTIRVTVAIEAGWHRVGVHDDGDGVPDEDTESIFEEFGRASGGTKVADSVGLGLSVSQRLAEAMGGKLSYRRADDWTTFELSLPSEAPAQAVGPDAVGQAAGRALSAHTG